MIDKEIESIVTEIYPLIKNNRCYAWIGAGFSYPDYLKLEDLIDKLCNACSVDFLDDLQKKSADLLMKKADDCKSANYEKYKNVLAAEYGKPVVNIRRAYKLLINLPFKGYITTNFDPILSTTATDGGLNNLFCYPSLPLENITYAEKPVCYIHGLARINNTPRGDNLVLSESEFEEAYSGEVSSIVYQIFKYNSVIFLGCSLSEPTFESVFGQVMRNIQKIQTQDLEVQPYSKFIILPKQKKIVVSLSEQSEKEIELRDKYIKWGIEPLYYTPSDDERLPEIERVFELISEKEGYAKFLKPSLGSLESIRL